jgi:hypothetical protein
MKIHDITLMFETLGCICLTMAFLFIVIGEIMEGFYFYVIGFAVFFTFMFIPVRKEYQTIRFLFSKLVETFKGRLAKISLVYFTLFLSLLCFWFNKVLEHEGVRAERWSAINMNTLVVRYLIIFFGGGILILFVCKAFPILLLFIIKQVKLKRYTSTLSLFLSIPSFLFVFFHGSQLASEVWLLTTVISIFSWTVVKGGGLLKKISYICREIAVTSMCVLIIAYSTWYVFPNPIYDQNYFAVTDYYLTTTDIWYFIDARLLDIRTYAWETKWYKDWGDLATSNKRFASAISSYDRLISELHDLEGLLKQVDESLHGENFLTIWLRDVVNQGVRFDLALISYAFNEAEFYVIYAKIFGNVSEKNLQLKYLDEMYYCKGDAEKIFDIMKNIANNTPGKVVIFYPNIWRFTKEFSARIQYLNESYYEAKNFIDNS